MNPNRSIQERIIALTHRLPETVRLVAVSKYQSSEAIVEAYDAGQRIFGESRVQELIAKQEELAPICLDLMWHFIGNLQSNKVKHIAPFIHMIQSVSSRKLLDEINKQALRYQRRIDVLLEVHVAEEETKQGFLPNELVDTLREIREHAQDYTGVRLCGLMAMASYTDDEVQIEREFGLVADLYQQIRNSDLLINPEDFEELSMGMSNDYPIALRKGATLIRLGTAVFGE